MKTQWLITNELYHYGVKGQKWGVRRKQDDELLSDKTKSDDKSISDKLKNKVLDEVIDREYDVNRKLLDSNVHNMVNKTETKMKAQNAKKAGFAIVAGLLLTVGTMVASRKIFSKLKEIRKGKSNPNIIDVKSRYVKTK